MGRLHVSRLKNVKSPVQTSSFHCSGYLYLHLQLIWDTESTRIEVIHLGKTTVKRKRRIYCILTDRAGLTGESWKCVHFLELVFFSLFWHTLFPLFFLSFLIFGFLNLHLKPCSITLYPFGNHTHSVSPNLNTGPAATHVGVTEPSLAPGPMQAHLSLNHLLSVDHTANYIEPDQRTR